VSTTPARTRSSSEARVQALALFPDLLALHTAHPARYPHLLESVSQGLHGRYDILFAFPQESLMLDAEGSLWRDDIHLGAGDFLTALDAIHGHVDHAPCESQLPFRGGWFLYLGYELARQIEPAAGVVTANPGLPVALAQRFPAAVVRDHVQRTTFLVCEQAQADQLLPVLEADVSAAGCAPSALPMQLETLAEEDSGRFLAAVAEAQAYIRAGDVFQVNLSRGWRAQLRQAVSPAALYQRLRSANPAPFAGLMTWRDAAIVSSSPERLVRVRGRKVSTRPIAGTYPRGATPQEDARLARALLDHPKERAEHVMLIDLERNDLGRVCRPGSVRVSELMGLETYRYVHHIVSEVEGELARVTPGQVIRALFPGGTITGCPKVRCMQIIAELEQGPRGAYTGSMGYLNHDGSLDLNILIRTLSMHGHSEVSLRAGAGIVADSVATRELEETRAKARGLLRALS
jgi:anthranilate synthase component 1